MARSLDKGILFQLQLTPLFVGLAERDILDLIADSTVETLPQGHALYAAGAEVEKFYVLLDGHVELSVEADNRRSMVDVARAGTVLGDAGLFSGGYFLMSARTLSAVTLLAIPAKSFIARLEPRFDILLHMLSTMSLRLRMLVRQIAELKLKTASQRLAGFLLSQTSVGSGSVEIRFPYDKKLVAEELGMKPESLSRALAKLASLGVESRPDNVVVIAHIGRLRQFCAEDDLG